MSRHILQIIPAILLLTAVAEARVMSLSPGHTLRIAGTSNIHDWSADVTEIDVDFTLETTTLTKIQDLRAEMFRSLVIRIPVEGISSKTSGLTGKIHKHLNKKQHTLIVFELTRVTEIDTELDTARITATGSLTAAGETHEVSLLVAATMSADDALSISGVAPLLMTSFGIKPPTEMFGAIKAADEISVSFNLSFE